LGRKNQEKRSDRRDRRDKRQSLSLAVHSEKRPDFKTERKRKRRAERRRDEARGKIKR